jgi:hypothetical protein
MPSAGADRAAKRTYRERCLIALQREKPSLDRTKAPFTPSQLVAVSAVDGLISGIVHGGQITS